MYSTYIYCLLCSRYCTDCSAYIFLKQTWTLLSENCSLGSGLGKYTWSNNGVHYTVMVTFLCQVGWTTEPPKIFECFGEDVFG